MSRHRKTSEDIFDNAEMISIDAPVTDPYSDDNEFPSWAHEEDGWDADEDE